MNKWKLKVNAHKTQSIPFTWKNKKYKHPKLRIFSEEIEDEPKSLKYLGVYLDKRLIFKKQIDETGKKAYAAMKYIYPYIYYTNPLSRKLKVHLYKA